MNDDEATRLGEVGRLGFMILRLRHEEAITRFAYQFAEY